MSRSGTTRTKIRSRRAVSGKAARLRIFIRRASLIGGAIVLVSWLGAWIFLSGEARRGMDWAGQTVSRVAVEKGFIINNVLVQGRENTDPDILRALIDVERGDPIFAFSPRETKTILERVSWIKEAHVERRLPDTVYIGLLERQPLALWQDKGKIRLVDAEGIVLSDHNLDKFADLLIIVGDDAPRHAAELVAMLRAEPELSSRIEAATWVSDRRWDLKLKSGAAVRLPEEDLGLALRRLGQAQESAGLLDRDIAVIDVREPDRMTVRTKPGAVEEYKADRAKASNI